MGARDMIISAIIIGLIISLYILTVRNIDLVILFIEGIHNGNH
jgi:hypothetical protein